MSILFISVSAPLGWLLREPPLQIKMPKAQTGKYHALHARELGFRPRSLPVFTAPATAQVLSVWDSDQTSEPRTSAGRDRAPPQPEQPQTAVLTHTARACSSH